jgi:SAM-dependent methyltransferase
MTEPQPGRIFDRRCRVCGSTGVRVQPFCYSLHSRRLYGVKCLKCSVVFLDPMPGDRELREMYSENYFTECTDTSGAHGPCPYFELAELSSEERKSGALRLDRILLQYRGGRGNLAEVGCGPGFFLADMRSLGWEVRGLEISEFAARYAAEKLGLDVAVAPIEDSVFPPDSLDAVFMGDVLEHLPDPVRSLRAVGVWLKPGAIVAVAVPSTLNLVSARLGMSLYRARGRFKTLRIPPYHLFEYTPGTLRTVLRTAGFEVLHLRQSTVPLRRMGLRGSPLENMGKAGLQVCARATSLLFNRGGDRLFAVARARL